MRYGTGTWLVGRLLLGSFVNSRKERGPSVVLRNVPNWSKEDRSRPRKRCLSPGVRRKERKVIR